jgi:hypothetical protein
VRILLTGDLHRGEFRQAVAETKQSGEIFEIACLASAAEWLRDSLTPVDLTIVAQARPGQFSEAAIEALRRPAPLTPIVALLGTWCEGEMRSGSPWPGVSRVYWHQWPERFRQEITKLAAGEVNAWSQPITATAEERLLSSGKTGRPIFHGLAAVMSDNSEMSDWLAATCRHCGLTTIAMRSAPTGEIAGVDVVLWDAGLPSHASIDTLLRAMRCFPGARIIVLADFPRIDDVERFVQLGALAVVSKPAAMADLIWNLGQVWQRFPLGGAFG